MSQEDKITRNMRYIKSSFADHNSAHPLSYLTLNMSDDEEDFFCTPESEVLSWINKHDMGNSTSPEKTFDEIALESTHPKGQKVNFNFESVSENENDPIL